MNGTRLRRGGLGSDGGRPRLSDVGATAASRDEKHNLEDRHPGDATRVERRATPVNRELCIARIAALQLASRDSRSTLVLSGLRYAGRPVTYRLVAVNGAVIDGCRVEVTSWSLLTVIDFLMVT